MIRPMVGYGGQSCDCCCELATDTRGALIQLSIRDESRQSLNGME